MKSYFLMKQKTNAKQTKPIQETILPTLGTFKAHILMRNIKKNPTELYFGPWSFIYLALHMASLMEFNFSI